MGLFSRGPQNYPMLPDIYSDYLKQQALQERAKKSTSPSKGKPGGSKRGGARMKPSIPGFSKKAAEAAKNVPDKYKGAYRKLFDQINDIYVKHADELKQYDLPIATIVGTKPINKTPEGHKIKMCPNQKNKSIKCELCQWCSKKDRKFIVGFLKD